MLYRHFFSLILVFALAFANCSSAADQKETVNPPQESSESTSEPTTDKAAFKLEKPETHLTGTFVSGEKFDSYDYVGNKLIFAFFNYKNKNAVALLKTVSELKDYEREKKFKIIPVSINHGEKAAVEKFLKDNGITLPTVLENSDLALAEQLQVQNEVSLVGLNNSHEIAFSLKKYEDRGEDANAGLLKNLEETLNIEKRFGTMPFLGIHPQAPDFKATTLDGKTITLSQFKGKVVLLFFFSPHCPHCQQEIAYLKEFVTPEVKAKGFEIIAVSVLEVVGRAKTQIEQFQLKDWYVIDGFDRKIKELYTQNTTIPEVFFIDREGKVRFYDKGYQPGYHANLNTMRLKKLLGLPNPPLLSSKRYNGVDTCMICHEDEYASWAVTPHAHAWETLEVKGEEFNVECAGCHSLGMNDPKGWKPRKMKNGETLAVVPEQYENIQCEHCHGIGGAHMSMPKSEEELKQTCLECHTKNFSLNFDYHERIEKVNHSDKEKVFAMSPEEKLALLKNVAKKPSQLFGSKIKYVGSDTCMQCHGDVHKNWKASAHGKAFESLKKDNKTTDPTCLQCHTVGYNQPGGYQDNKKPDFEGVGCESCHGPGEIHIKTKKKADIRDLGDDCPFCVIEQICLSCHDSKNDPDFNIYKGLETIKGHK